MNSALASFAVLLAVVISIPLVLWLVKRLSQLSPGDARGVLSVPASLAVGPRERIAVLKVGERTLLVGITTQSIQLLTELDGDLPLPPATRAAGNFGPLLARLKKGTAAGAAADSRPVIQPKNHSEMIEKGGPPPLNAASSTARGAGGSTPMSAPFNKREHE